MPFTHEGFRCDGEGCGRIYPISLEHAEEVIGFEHRRRDGGPDRLVAKRRTGKVLCAACFAAMRDGVPPGQGRLGL